MLTGEFNPSGRLVVTWYTGNEQLPPMVNYSMVNRTYRYMVDKPQYYFGYGLSYTIFNYSGLVVSMPNELMCIMRQKKKKKKMMCDAIFMTQIQPMTIMPCNMVQVQISVTNIGKVTGSEVVQFYFEYMVALM